MQQARSASAARKCPAIAQAVSFVLLGLGAQALPTAPALAAAAPDATVQREYNIPAGRLSDVLAQFAATAGVPLSFDPQLLADQQSPGLRGSYTARDGFATLLTGSGYELDDRGNGGWSLRPAASGATTLSAVRVEESIDPLADPGRTEGSSSYTAPATGTAFKLPLTLRETPQTVTIVPQAVIQDFGLTDIRQIMLFTPGVTVSAERGPQAYYFEARGNALQVQYDGVPSSNRFGGRGSGMTFDSAIVDRVEVLHGAAGLLTGPGSPGGTVNVVRKLPTATAQATVEASADSWGGWRAMADASGPLGDGGLGGRLVAVYENQDFYIDYTSAKHSLIYGVLGQRFGESTDLYLGINLEQVSDGSYGPHYGLPAEIDGTPMDIPRKKNLGAAWSDQDDKLNTVYMRLQHLFSPDWSLQGIVTYEDYKTTQQEGVTFREREPELLEDIYFAPSIERWGSETWAADLFLQGRFNLLGRSHQLMAGFNGSKREEWGNSEYSTGELVPVDIETWDAREAPSPNSVVYEGYKYAGEYQQYGVFGGARFSLLDPLHLIVGTRLSWVEQSWDGVTADKEDAVNTWYGGLVWDFAKNWSAYASYSDIFEPHGVGTRDREGNVLDPIVGENLETGLKFEAFEGRLNGALAVFRLDQTNLAEPDYEGVMPGICGEPELDFCYTASGLVRSEGYELSLSGEVARGWEVYGGYTNFSRKYRTGEEGGDPYDAKTPTEYLQVGGRYSAPGDRWSVGASARWQETVAYEGTLYFMPEQSFRTEQKAFTIMGLFANFKVTPKLNLSANVDNLFDEKYFSGLEWPLGGLVYGDARKFSVTLRAQF